MIYIKNPELYIADKKSSQFLVHTKYGDQPEELQPAFKLVQDAVAKIRTSHRHAVERCEDVEVLNEYANLLMHGG